MNRKYGIATTVLLCVAMVAAATPLWAEDKIDLHVSDNGRFLVHTDGSGFFPVADTAWAIAWRLTREEVERYMVRRKAQQFNTVALVAFPSYDGMKILANAYGDYPFQDHLEYVIDTAHSQGMYVTLLPAWGGYVAGSYVKGEPSAELLFDAGSAYEYGNWIGHRFGKKENIIWMMGGDRSAVYGERDYRDVFRAVAEGVADGVNGIDQQDSKADYSTTLMSFHPRKWHPNSSEWFHQDSWLDFNSMQDQPIDQITATELDFSLSPSKPTWLFEGGYEFRSRGENVYKDWQIRFQSYQTVFAGGFGITYGSMNIYHCGGGVLALDEPVTTGNATEFEVALEEPGAMDMQHLYTLMTSMTREQFLDRIPDQKLLDGDPGSMDIGEGVRSGCLQATRGAKGDYAMIYSANGREIRVKMDQLSSEPMKAFWFNPRNGKWRLGEAESPERKAFLENISSGPGAPIQAFDPPGDVADGNDWVLVLTAGGVGV